MNREAIYAALFEKLKAVPGLVFSSRRLQHWSDVPAINQPALFMAQTGQSCTQVRGMPKKWTFAAQVYVYANTSGDDAPASVLNPLLDAIEAALTPDIGVVCQTLGGLVEHCWIEGEIQTDEGALGDQAIAVIPISILVTSK